MGLFQQTVRARARGWQVDRPHCAALRLLSAEIRAQSRRKPITVALLEAVADRLQPAKPMKIPAWRAAPTTPRPVSPTCHCQLTRRSRLFRSAGSAHAVNTFLPALVSAFALSLAGGVDNAAYIGAADGALATADHRVERHQTAPHMPAAQRRRSGAIIAPPPPCCSPVATCHGASHCG